MLIHVVRHTQPDIEPGICYGQTDLSVADSFEFESAQITAKLASHYDAVFSSPLQRCALLGEKLNSDRTFIDSRLLEYNFGDWEMKSWDDFKSLEQQQWMDNYISHTPPNGENLMSMQLRVKSFWSELQVQNFDKVAIVTHAGVIRILHGLVFDTPLSHLFRLQLDYGAVIEISSLPESNLLTLKHL